MSLYPIESRRVDESKAFDSGVNFKRDQDAPSTEFKNNNHRNRAFFVWTVSMKLFRTELMLNGS